MTKEKSNKNAFPLSQNEFWILASLAERPKHGYAIAKHVLELTEGKKKFSAATLYDNISNMLDTGLIERDGEKEIEPGERRKTYRITGLGTKVLNEHWRILQRAGVFVAKGASPVMSADLTCEIA